MEHWLSGSNGTSRHTGDGGRVQPSDASGHWTVTTSMTSNAFVQPPPHSHLSSFTRVGGLGRNSLLDARPPGNRNVRVLQPGDPLVADGGRSELLLTPSGR